ncbi:MAG: hypothetical protein AAF533_21780 [Acidobacteriota bacterium]
MTGPATRRFRGVPSGKGAFAAILGLAVLIAALHVGAKTLPVSIRHRQLTDEIETRMKEFTNGELDEATARAHILGRAEELGLPIDETDLVTRPDAGTLSVQLRYELERSMIWGTWRTEHEIVREPGMVMSMDDDAVTNRGD